MDDFLYRFGGAICVGIFFVGGGAGYSDDRQGRRLTNANRSSVAELAPGQP